MEAEPYHDVPLDEQLSKAVREHFFTKKRGNTILYLLFVAVLVTVILFGIAFAFQIQDVDLIENLILILVFTSFVLIGVPLTVTSSWLRRGIHARFRKELERVIGLSWISRVSQESITGDVFRMGHSQLAVNAYAGEYKGFPVRTYMHRYTVGHGKTSRSYGLWVREFDCGFPLPEFVLMPKSLPRENPLWKPKGTARVRLEGNFSDHFDVWIETQYEIEAMVVLEPHVMTLMLDEFPECGFECAGTKFYVFSNRNMPQRIMDFVADQGRVRHLFDEMLPELRQVSRDIVAMKEAFKK